MKNNKAIFPGSFDPITFGHIDIIKSALNLFEMVVVAVGRNEQKKYMFDIKKRKQFIELIFKNNNRVIVKDYQNLTVDFCKEQKATHIIRGIRNNVDFEYEKNIAFANNQLSDHIQTIFLLTKKEHDFISSSVVREIIINQGHVKGYLESFIPKGIILKILSESKN